LPRKDNTNVINYFIHYNFWTTQIFEVSTQKKKKKKREEKTKKEKKLSVKIKQKKPKIQQTISTRLLEDCTFFCFTHGYICNKSDGWY
jgi:hypothetical protein